MLLSHNFGSLEMLNRARFWLTWHGFQVQEAHHNAETRPSPRLSVRVNVGRSAAALALIDSIERNDPDAWPGVGTVVKRQWVLDQPASPDSRTVAGTSTPHGTPIHWDSRDQAGDAVAHRVAEYMFSRWE